MANTIQEKLAYLEETKGLIKEAIKAKGVEVTDTDTFRSYANKIEAIQAGGSIAGLPSGIRFGNSQFTTFPTEIIPYLESQTNMMSMFSSCNSLTSVPLFDTKNVTDMSYMFSYCNSLTSVPLFDTKNVTNMSYMFNGCMKLKTIPQFDTKNVTNMNSMFSYCNSLTSVPLFDTKNVTNMNLMFCYCNSLTSVPLFDTKNVTNMNSMFSSCNSLTSVPLFDTKNVTNMNYMFSSCNSLTSVPLIDTNRTKFMSGMFNYCRSLTNLGGFTGLKVNLGLTGCPLLTTDSVMNVVNNAENMSSEPKTLTLHQDVFNKLTQEQIATATAKGWNIASA